MAELTDCLIQDAASVRFQALNYCRLEFQRQLLSLSLSITSVSCGVIIIENLSYS